MKHLTRHLKHMLDALASADAGEYLSLQQKARYLAPASQEQRREQPPAEKSTATAKKWIGLYLGSELPQHVTDYVLQTCLRMRQGLVILTLQDEAEAHTLAAPLVAAFKDAGLALRMEYLYGEPVASLARALRRHPEISFLTCNETGFLGRALTRGTQGVDSLPVPVVLVAPRDSEASLRQDAATPSAARTA